MIRELAGYDPARVPAVLRYPLRDGLVAFSERMRIEALAAYRHETLLFVLGGTKEQPRPPSILQPAR